jgi:hypothetical protein
MIEKIIYIYIYIYIILSVKHDQNINNSFLFSFPMLTEATYLTAYLLLWNWLFDSCSKTTILQSIHFSFIMLLSMSLFYSSRDLTKESVNISTSIIV